MEPIEFINQMKILGEKSSNRLLFYKLVLNYKLLTLYDFRYYYYHYCYHDIIQMKPLEQESWWLPSLRRQRGT